ncbi:Expressed protein precursor, partial [hydrothermal vent metagenome]
MSNQKTEKLGKILIPSITIAAIIAMFFIQPIPQDSAYHNFVDGRTILGIANFWNVMSNLPFLLVGVMGLIQLQRLKTIAEMGVAYWLLFFGVALVAFGSGYYHLAPDNHTLVWDRLPMTIAFMSLFAIIIAEFINIQKGRLLLFPLLIVGVLSVFYWQYTEANGAGDLRFYALVQFLPIVLIPIMLLLFPAKFSKVSGYWWLLLAYVIAKFLEYFDTQIFALSANIISGHSIKHMAAAFGMYILLVSY